MAEAVIGDRIKIYGYELEKKFIYVGEFFPRISLATKYQNELFDLLVSDIRFWKEKNSEKTSVKVFLGDPSADNWLRNSKVLGLLDSISIIFHIILDKFEKKSIYWILKKNEDKWSGYSASFLKKFLSPYRNISAP